MLEKDVWNDLRGCPGIIQLYATFQDQNHLFFVMELAEKGDLFALVKSQKCLTPSEARFYMVELVSALSFIHEHGIIYRDLKPEVIWMI